jgi:hypothetical protein
MFEEAQEKAEKKCCRRARLMEQEGRDGFDEV